MSYALALIGFLGFFITNIYMIIQAVKKEVSKKITASTTYMFHLVYYRRKPDAFFYKSSHKDDSNIA